MSIHMLGLKLSGITLLIIGFLPQWIEVDTPMWLHVVCAILGIVLIIVREDEIFEF